MHRVRFFIFFGVFYFVLQVFGNPRRVGYTLLPPQAGCATESKRLTRRGIGLLIQMLRPFVPPLAEMLAVYSTWFVRVRGVPGVGIRNLAHRKRTTTILSFIANDS